MDFTYDDNQQMLFDTVDRFLSDKYDLTRRKALLDDSAGQDSLWQEIAELGLIGAAFPEDAGGFASSPVDTLVVLERLGRHLVTLPYLHTAVLCGRLLLDGLDEGACGDLVAQIVAGGCRLAFAAGNGQTLHSPENNGFSAKSQGAGFVIDGRMSVVPGADVANRLIVAARTAGSFGEVPGITLFLIDADAPGVTRRAFRMIDGHGAAEVVIEGLAVGQDAIVGGQDDGAALANIAYDHAIAGLCAEALGSMSHLVPATAEYTRTREQYGAPLAKFQVLQHRMADMYIQTETARSMAYVATLSLGDEPLRRQRIVSAAKVQVGRSGKFVGYNAVQLHGGMGVAEELDIGHHYVRLTAIAQLFGNQSHHLRRFAELGRQPEATPL